MPWSTGWVRGGVGSSEEGRKKAVLASRVESDDGCSDVWEGRNEAARRRADLGMVMPAGKGLTAGSDASVDWDRVRRLCSVMVVWTLWRGGGGL